MSKRKKKLIEPRLQWKFALLFLASAGTATVLQTLVLNFLLRRTAGSLQREGMLLLEQIPGILSQSMLISFGLLAPVLLALGITTTFRVVGPLYRFRQFLRQVVRGEHPGACVIRKGDELHDFCELLNEVTAPLREAAAADGDREAPESAKQEQEQEQEQAA